MTGKSAIGNEDAVRRQCLVQLTAEPGHVDWPLRGIEARRRFVAP